MPTPAGRGRRPAQRPSGAAVPLKPDAATAPLCRASCARCCWIRPRLGVGVGVGMEFLLGNPFSTAVGQRIGELPFGRSASVRPQRRNRDRRALTRC